MQNFTDRQNCIPDHIREDFISAGVRYTWVNQHYVYMAGKQAYLTSVKKLDNGYYVVRPHGIKHTALSLSKAMEIYHDAISRWPKRGYTPKPVAQETELGVNELDFEMF